MARLVVPAFEGHSAELLQVETEPDGKTVSVSCMMRKIERGDIDVEWAYAFNLTEYRKAAERERR